MLAIFGATATGKSTLAHAAAKALGGEIVVCDPFQRYRGLEIAADGPSAQDRAEVPYHLVGDLDLAEGSSAADFARLAHQAVDAILCRGRVPIVSGGTGLYLRAALCRLSFPPAPDPETRARAEALVDGDLAAAAEHLAALDPEAAARIDLRNPRRVSRALERALGTDRRDGDDALWTAPLRHPTLLVGLVRPRDVLAPMIDARIAREIADGLIAELDAVLARHDRHRAVGQIIGLREVAAIGAGELDPADLPARLGARTRRLARAQLTWQRKLPGLVELDIGDGPAIDALPALLALWERSGL